MSSSKAPLLVETEQVHLFRCLLPIIIISIVSSPLPQGPELRDWRPLANDDDKRAAYLYLHLESNYNNNTHNKTLNKVHSFRSLARPLSLI